MFLVCVKIKVLGTDRTSSLLSRSEIPAKSFYNNDKASSFLKQKVIVRCMHYNNIIIILTLILLIGLADRKIFGRLIFPATTTGLFK